MKSLVGKVALVTGAASGIGRATAQLFAEHSAIVIAADRHLTDAFSDHDKVTAAMLDVRQEADWSRVVGDIIRQNGRIDILVNNAGISGSMKQVHDETLDDWHQVIAVNQTGVFLGIRAVLPFMRQQQMGSIVNISSAWGIVATEGGFTYQSSKGAVRQMTKNAAVTYAAEGVRVNSIHPGMVETPAVIGHMPDEIGKAFVDRTPMGRMAMPIEIARGILFLASDDASFVTGSELVMDGGYTAQ